MTLTRDEREYVASLVALLRSDRPLDPPLSSPVSLADFMSHKRGLARWDRDAIADIVEYFFRRKDGKKQGRPPDTMFEIFAASSRLVTYHRLVLSELSDGKSYAEAIKNVARREGLKPSSLKRYLRSLKVESRPYTDEELAVFAESNERFQYVCLVQDEINAGKTYDEAVQIVAKRKRVDPSRLKRITKTVFGG
jgi:hypothetical protein